MRYTAFVAARIFSTWAPRRLAMKAMKAMKDITREFARFCIATWHRIVVHGALYLYTLIWNVSNVPHLFEPWSSLANRARWSFTDCTNDASRSQASIHDSPWNSPWKEDGGELWRGPGIVLASNSSWSIGRRGLRASVFVRIRISSRGNNKLPPLEAVLYLSSWVARISPSSFFFLVSQDHCYGIQLRAKTCFVVSPIRLLLLCFMPLPLPSFISFLSPVWQCAFSTARTVFTVCSYTEEARTNKCENEEVEGAWTQTQFTLPGLAAVYCAF